jgi:hypothetical protein
VSEHADWSAPFDLEQFKKDFAMSIQDPPRSLLSLPPNERREVIVLIQERLIIDMLNGLQNFEFLSIDNVKSKLPEGYSIRGIWPCPGRRCFEAIVSHPSFEPVPDGGLPPYWNGQIDARQIVFKRQPISLTHIRVDDEPVKGYVSASPWPIREVIRQSAESPAEVTEELPEESWRDRPSQL